MQKERYNEPMEHKLIERKIRELNINRETILTQREREREMNNKEKQSLR